jgi:hypothetical protein
VGLHHVLAFLPGVAVVDTFSVTEPVTLIHLSCPLWMIGTNVSMIAPLASVLVGVLAATRRRAVSSVGAHVVPLVEGEVTSVLDRRDVCPGGPTGQGSAVGQIVRLGRSRTVRSRQR